MQVVLGMVVLVAFLVGHFPPAIGSPGFLVTHFKLFASAANDMSYIGLLFLFMPTSGIIQGERKYLVAALVATGPLPSQQVPAVCSCRPLGSTAVSSCR